MKQAILILAYKDVKHLIHLVKCFDDEFCFYIHFKRSSQLNEDDLHELQSLKNVKLVSRKFDVNWGGYKLLQVILYLAEEALKNEDVQYFHLISGQDFPVKDSAYFHQILQKNKGKEFIEYVSPPDQQFKKRLSYYYLFDLINAKKGKGSIRVFTLIRLQKRLHFKRNDPKVENLAVGSAWWTLSYPCLKYVIEYTKKDPSFLRRLRYTWCPEEFYFQTILLNSPFKQNIINDNLRFINWSEKNGSHPAILDEEDFENIKHSTKLFARKIEMPTSSALLKSLMGMISEAKYTEA